MTVGGADYGLSAAAPPLPVKELRAPGGERARPRWAHHCHIRGPALRKPSLRVSSPWNPEIRDEERALAGVGHGRGQLLGHRTFPRGP